VKVHPRLDERGRILLLDGTRIDGKDARPEEVEIESHGPRSSWVRFTLREGRNREIRRLCAGAGLDVEHLIRIAYGPVALADLAPGAFRILEEAESRELRAAARIS
jgi:23S rRNA pseudouridine2605 synthase